MGWEAPTYSICRFNR